MFTLFSAYSAMAVSHDDTAEHLVPQLQRFVIEKIENMWFTDHLFHEAGDVVGEH